MKRIIIPGRLPGLNDAFNLARTNRQIEAKERRKNEDFIIFCIRRYLRGWRAKGPVILHYTFIEPNRRRDKDNIAGYARKLIQDSLVKAGTLKGDGWNYIENSTEAWGVDKAHPRVLVDIEEVNSK